MKSSIATAIRRRKTKATLRAKGIHVGSAHHRKKKKATKKKAAKRPAPKRTAPKRRKKAAKKARAPKKKTGSREHFVRSVMAKGQSRAQAEGLWKARHARRKKKKAKTKARAKKKRKGHAALAQAVARRSVADSTSRLTGWASRDQALRRAFWNHPGASHEQIDWGEDQGGKSWLRELEAAFKTLEKKGKLERKGDRVRLR